MFTQSQSILYFSAETIAGYKSCRLQYFEVFWSSTNTEYFRGTRQFFVKYNRMNQTIQATSGKDNEGTLFKTLKSCNAIPGWIFLVKKKENRSDWKRKGPTFDNRNQHNLLTAAAMGDCPSTLEDYVGFQ